MGLCSKAEGLFSGRGRTGSKFGEAEGDPGGRAGPLPAELFPRTSRGRERLASPPVTGQSSVSGAVDEESPPTRVAAEEGGMRDAPAAGMGSTGSYGRANDSPPLNASFPRYEPRRMALLRRSPPLSPPEEMRSDARPGLPPALSELGQRAQDHRELPPEPPPR